MSPASVILLTVAASFFTGEAPASQSPIPNDHISETAAAPSVALHPGTARAPQPTSSKSAASRMRTRRLQLLTLPLSVTPTLMIACDPVTAVMTTPAGPPAADE